MHHSLSSSMYPSSSSGAGLQQIQSPLVTPTAMAFVPNHGGAMTASVSQLPRPPPHSSLPTPPQVTPPQANNNLTATTATAYTSRIGAVNTFIPNLHTRIGSSSCYDHSSNTVLLRPQHPQQNVSSSSVFSDPTPSFRQSSTVRLHGPPPPPPNIAPQPTPGNVYSSFVLSVPPQPRQGPSSFPAVISANPPIPFFAEPPPPPSAATMGRPAAGGLTATTTAETVSIVGNVARSMVVAASSALSRDNGAFLARQNYYPFFIH